MKPEYHSRAFIINLSCNYMLLMLFSFCAICRLLIKLPLIRLQVYFSFISSLSLFLIFNFSTTFVEVLQCYCVYGKWHLFHPSEFFTNLKIFHLNELFGNDSANLTASKCDITSHPATPELSRVDSC